MENLQELFVTYELALKIKEKGFNEGCFGYYSGDNPYGELPYKLNIIKCKKQDSIDDLAGRCLAPTHQQCVDWLRINHRIEVSSPCKKDKDLGVFYGGYVKKYDDDFGKSYGSNFRDYYEAYNHGIEEALKII